jgi:MFS family permease
LKWPHKFTSLWSRSISGVLSGYTVAQFGVGLVMPFLMVYVHNVLHFSSGFAGIVISTGNISGAVFIPLSGIMVERLGARWTTGMWIVVSAGGFSSFILGRNHIVLLLASAAATGGMAAWWNSLSAMLSGFKEVRRTSVFALAYVLQNVGSGVGAIVGGRLISGGKMASFVEAFLLASLCSVAFAVLVSGAMGRRKESKESGLAAVNVAHTDYSLPSLSRYRPLIALGVVYGLFAIIITALPGSAFSVWAVNKVGVPTNVVGIAVSISTFVVIFGQFFVLWYTKGYRRTRLSVLSAICYGLGVVSIYAAQFSAAHLLALGELYGAFVMFGVGDTFLFAVVPALVNDLAPVGQRGRYNSVINLCWQMGSMAGPLLSGVMLQTGRMTMFFFSLVFLCALIGVTLRGAECRIPDVVNRG